MKLKKIILFSIAIQLVSVAHAVTTAEIISVKNNLKSANTNLKNAIKAQATPPSDTPTPISAPNESTAPTPIAAPTFTPVTTGGSTPPNNGGGSPGGNIPDFVADTAPTPIAAPTYTVADNAPTPIPAPPGYKAPDTSPAPIKAPQFIPDLVPAPIAAPIYVQSMKDIAIRNKKINDNAQVEFEGLVDAQYNARELAIIDKWEVQSDDQAPYAVAAPRLNPVPVCDVAIEQKMGQKLAKYNNNTGVKIELLFQITKVIKHEGADDEIIKEGVTAELPDKKCFAQFIEPGASIDMSVKNLSNADSDGNVGSAYQAVQADIGNKSCDIELSVNGKPVISVIG